MAFNNISSQLNVTTNSINQTEQTVADLPNSLKSIFTEEVSQTKLLASLVLFVITLTCGYLPVRTILNQNYIQYAMFAGGGVLMATAFCHLIPETHDNYKLTTVNFQQEHLHLHYHHDHQHQLINATTTAASNSSANSNGTDTGAGSDSIAGTIMIPYVEVVLCCGFFFMYLVEQLMVRFINNHTHEHPCDTSTGQLVQAGDSNSRAPSEQLNGGIDGATGVAINLSARSTSKPSTEFYKFIRGLLIVSAFGAHSIFDGVAIGSQETVEKVWTIFLAISCHKLIIAAVVGLELYTATLESHLWTLVHLSIFSIMSPIGIILVVVAQNSLHIDSNHPAMILLQSFATGTLLYIVFVEILQPKGNQAFDKNRLGKSVSMVAGFGLMLLVLTLIDH